MTNCGVEDCAEVASFSSVSPTYVCSGDAARLVPPGSTLVTLWSFLGKKLVACDVSQGDKVSASAGQGGNVCDQWSWEPGEVSFPFLFHLIFYDPS